MKKWSEPDSYFGAQYTEYYILLGKNRDSGDLQRANFDAALARLGGESEIEPDDNGTYVDGAYVYVAHLGHWACGWIELILIHQNAPFATMRKAKQIEIDLDNYPILDEDLYSQYQDETAYSFWKGMSLKERIEVCARFKCNIFAARHADRLPQDDNGSLFCYLTSD